MVLPNQSTITLKPSSRLPMAIITLIDFAREPCSLLHTKHPSDMTHLGVPI